MARYIYSMIIDNTYDYDNGGTTTDDIETAYGWIRAGVKQVAILDSCDLSYHGYLDMEDLPEFKAQFDGC